MAELQLTKSMELSFEILFSWSKEKLKKLLDLLNLSGLGLSPKIAAEKFYKDIDVQQDALEKVVHIIYSITYLKVSSKYADEKIVDDFSAVLLKLDKKLTKEKCKDYLSIILKQNESVYLTVAASELATERERLLRDISILTDIRPIFDKDDFKGSIIVHTLKIEFIDNENNKNKSTIYLTIDKSDMEKIEKIIQKAKIRENLLKTNVSGTIVDLTS